MTLTEANEKIEELRHTTSLLTESDCEAMRIASSAIEDMKWIKEMINSDTLSMFEICWNLKNITECYDDKEEI